MSATQNHPIPIDIRRAVLSVFLRAGGGPLTIDDVVERTRTEAHLDLASLPGVGPRQRVSDIMRHQVRAGRAEVVGRGRYRLRPEAFSESTRWRILHWREAAARRERYPRWVSLSRGSTPSSAAGAGSRSRSDPSPG